MQQLAKVQSFVIVLKAKMAHQHQNEALKYFSPCLMRLCDE
jgi:hypothetical protein